MVEGPPELAAGRALVANACRVLAAEGLVETILGHVSLRVDERRLLVRARGPDERGLRFTTPADVVLVDLDGHPQPGETDLRLPSELPIHTELLRARPDARAVVHAHPPEIVTCTVVGIGLRPIVGAYNIGAYRLARQGIPTYDYAGLIRDASRASGLVDAMGDSSACLLQGHGLVTCAGTVEEAVLVALDLCQLARVTLACAATGRVPHEVDEDDAVDLPDLGATHRAQLWRFYAAHADEVLGGPPPGRRESPS